MAPNGRKAAAVMDGDSKRVYGSAMLCRAIAHIPRPAISGKGPVKIDHYDITTVFGDDRGRGDIHADGISAYDTLRRQVGWWHLVPVNQHLYHRAMPCHMQARCQACGNICHRRQCCLQQTDAVDGRHINMRQAVDMRTGGQTGIHISASGGAEFL